MDNKQNGVQGWAIGRLSSLNEHSNCEYAVSKKEEILKQLNEEFRKIDKQTIGGAEG